MVSGRNHMASDLKWPGIPNSRTSCIAKARRIKSAPRFSPRSSANSLPPPNQDCPIPTPIRVCAPPSPPRKKPICRATRWSARSSALQRVARHIGFFRGGDGGAQTRIGIGIGQSRFGGGSELADDLGENLGALFILRAFAMHDVLELGMPGHFRSLAM